MDEKQKIKIVIVEDEYLIALGTRNHLLQMGYAVPAIYPSGQRALAGIEAEQPDLAKKYEMTVVFGRMSITILPSIRKLNFPAAYAPNA